jgi:hypothetical protein
MYFRFGARHIGMNGLGNNNNWISQVRFGRRPFDPVTHSLISGYPSRNFTSPGHPLDITFQSREHSLATSCERRSVDTLGPPSDLHFRCQFSASPGRRRDVIQDVPQRHRRDAAGMLLPDVPLRQRRYVSPLCRKMSEYGVPPT